MVFGGDYYVGFSRRLLRKAIYRGLAKNDNKLAMLFALANVFRVDQMIRAARG